MQLFTRSRMLVPAIFFLSCAGFDPDHYDTEWVTVAPSMLVSTPDHAANNNFPLISGLAPEGAVMVTLFTDPDCSEPAGVEGEAAAFENSGFDVQVDDDSETTFYAQSTDALGVSSLCSPQGVTYVERSTITQTQPVVLAPVASAPGEPIPTGFVGLEIAGVTTILRVDDELSCNAPLTRTTVGARDTALDWNPLCEPSNGDTADWDGGERVMHFTVPSEGRYRFELDWQNLGNADLDLFVLRRSPDSGQFACTDFSWAFPPSNDSVTVEALSAGEQLIIVVDGFEGDEGVFSLSATCPD